MKHIRALIIKFILITAVLLVTLGFLYGVDFGEILTISVILTITAYLIGDMVFLPRYGNIAATVADFGLAYLGTWLIGAMIIEEPIRLGVASFISALFIAIAEAFFHRYLTKSIINEGEKKDLDYLRPSYQTEFAEELIPDVKSEKNNFTNANEKYTTEFGEETYTNLTTKSSSTAHINYDKTKTNTEFGEENYSFTKNGTNTPNNNNETEKYKTELGEDFPDFKKSEKMTNEKIGMSPNVTRDPSYYLSGFDFQSGYNFVPVTENQTRNETANEDENPNSET